MESSLNDILSLTNEAAAVVRHGRVLFANHAAGTVIGPDCAGRSVKDVFGKEIGGVQAGSFLSSFQAGGRGYFLRVTAVDDAQIFFISPQDTRDELVNDAFLYSLRTTLSSFSMANEQALLLNEDDNDPVMRSYLCRINKDIYMISRIIRNISAVRNALNGTQVREPRIFDLASLCRGTAAMLNTLFPEENILFEHKDAVPVCADPGGIELLILNLLSNSIAHAEGHSRVLLSLNEFPDTVIISVSDDGCGIPRELLPKVFARYRYGFTLSEMSRGVGFGLSAALSMAQLHGGTLVLESREGIGTSVKAYIHRNIANALDAPAEEYCGDLRTLLAFLSTSLGSEHYTVRLED